MKNIAEVLTAHSLSLSVDAENPVALFVTGDFNSGPDSTSSQLMHNQPFTEKSFELLDRDVQRAYDESLLKREFVACLYAEMKANQDLFKNVLGHLQSAYSHYDRLQDPGCEPEERKLSDSHPLFTNYSHHFHGCFDFIYSSPSTARVTHLLELPSEDTIASDAHKYLPSTQFPSDHIRVQSKFEVYY